MLLTVAAILSAVVFRLKHRWLSVRWRESTRVGSAYLWGYVSFVSAFGSTLLGFKDDKSQ
jgi:hypothetical protein